MLFFKCFESGVDRGSVDAGQSGDQLLRKLDRAQRFIVFGGEIVKIESLINFFDGAGGIVLEDKIVGIAGF